MEQRPYAEACAMTGLPQSTLNNQVHRGKLKLSAFLRDEVQAYVRSPPELVEELRSLQRHVAL